MKIPGTSGTLVFVLIFIFSHGQTLCPRGNYFGALKDLKIIRDNNFTIGKPNFHQIDPHLQVVNQSFFVSSKNTLWETTGLLSKFSNSKLSWRIQLNCSIDNFLVDGDIIFVVGSYRTSCQFGHITLELSKESMLDLISPNPWIGFYLAKFDLAGRFLSVFRIGETHYYENFDTSIHSLKMDNTGHLILSGNYNYFFEFYTKAFSSAFKKCYVLNYTRDGVLTGSNNVVGSCRQMSIDSDNSVILAGFFQKRYIREDTFDIHGSFSKDVFWLKLQGEKYQFIKFGGNKYGDDYISGFSIGKSNIYMIGQMSHDSHIDGVDYTDPIKGKFCVFIKADKETGKVVTYKVLGGFQLSSHSISLDSEESIYVSGIQLNQTILFKYDSNGNLIWKEPLGVYRTDPTTESVPIIIEKEKIWIASRFSSYETKLMVPSAGRSDIIVTQFHNTMKAGCSPCPPGTFESERKCQECPENTYSDAFGSTSCRVCDLKMKSNRGSSHCVKANVSCPPGTHGVGEKCIDCPIGTYSLEGLTCRRCPTSTFTNSTRSQFCTSCPCKKTSFDGIHCIEKTEFGYIFDALLIVLISLIFWIYKYPSAQVNPVIKVVEKANEEKIEETLKIEAKEEPIEVKYIDTPKKALSPPHTPLHKRLEKEPKTPQTPRSDRIEKLREIINKELDTLYEDEFGLQHALQEE